MKLHKPLSIGNQVQFSRHNHILLILFNYKFMRYRSVRIFDKLSIANNSMFRQWCLRLTSKLIAVKCALNHTNFCQKWQTTDPSGQTGARKWQRTGQVGVDKRSRTFNQPHIAGVRLAYAVDCLLSAKPGTCTVLGANLADLHRLNEKSGSVPLPTQSSRTRRIPLAGAS